MIALDQATDALRCARRALVCFVLAGCAVFAHAQVQGKSVKTGSKEGTLVVNYYSSAPDPELEQLRGLALEALGVFLRGEMRVDGQDLGWESPVKGVKRDMERIVRDVMRIRSFEGQQTFSGFSEEVDLLLEDFEELDMRDVERMRGTGSRSFEERIYVLIEQRIQELLLQCGVELGRYVNHGLLVKIGTVEQDLPVEELEKWMSRDDNPLEPLELNFNLETMSLLDRKDDSSWPDGSGQTADLPSEWASMQDMMQRILDLVEAQEARLTALERGSPPTSGGAGASQRDLAEQTWSPTRNTPATDPALRDLNLPSSFDVQFYEGSSRLTLTAQLQLNEVLEYMGMYPQLRVVCTGHADVTGDRSANLTLSKKRAQAVRAHLLESGVGSTRVVLNYFGEERANNQGALDRRVEVAFFVND
jgi:outer membrane protein OmpA-like peptidoglycan-associated protein